MTTPRPGRRPSHPADGSGADARFGTAAVAMLLGSLLLIAADGIIASVFGAATLTCWAIAAVASTRRARGSATPSAVIVAVPILAVATTALAAHRH